MRALHFVYITMDGLHNAALREAATMLHQEHGVQMNLHLYQTSAMRSPDDWARLERDVQQADFIFGCMIFGEEHVRPLQNLLQAVETPTCMITSNPMISSAYGALMGFLLGGSFPGAARNSEEREANPDQK